MFQNLTGWHALIVLGVVLLVFGAAKLPALARSVGQSVRILKEEAADTRHDTTAPVAPVEEPTPTKPLPVRSGAVTTPSSEGP